MVNIFDTSFCWEEYKKHIYIYNKYYTSKIYPDRSEIIKNCNKKSKIRRQINKELIKNYQFQNGLQLFYMIQVY